MQISESLDFVLPCWLTSLLQGYRWPCQQDNPHTWHLACMCEGVLCVWVYVSYHETTVANWCELFHWSNQEQHKSHLFPNTIHHMTESGAKSVCPVQNQSILRLQKLLSKELYDMGEFRICMIVSRISIFQVDCLFIWNKINQWFPTWRLGLSEQDKYKVLQDYYHDRKYEKVLISLIFSFFLWNTV